MNPRRLPSLLAGLAVLSLACSSPTVDDPDSPLPPDAGALDGGGTGSDAGDSTDAGEPTCELVEPAITGGVHVSPTGSATGAGTEASPIDLATALSSSGPARPGDTIWLAGGTYRGKFTSTLRGTSDARIVVRARPGERATIDGELGDAAALSVDGEWTDFMDLELTSSDATRSEFGEGVQVLGPYNRFINCVVHDNAQGYGFWSSALDSEIYGNVIYNNGWNGPDRGHGHAIYTQNRDGTKRLHDNVLFFGFSFGIHAYTEGGSIQGFDIRGNAWFSAGASMPDGGGLKDNCLVGGLQPADRIVLAENYGWASTPGSRGVRLGYSESVANGAATLLDNVLVGQLTVVSSWTSFTATGNEIFGDSPAITSASFPDNTYSAALPTEQRVVLRPNAYDPGRANLVIYNPADADSVAVDLEGTVDRGAPYEIFSVYDLYGTPVASGVYEGGSVDVPMGTKPPPQPNGAEGAIVATDDPGRAYGVFIVKHARCRE